MKMYHVMITASGILLSLSLATSAFAQFESASGKLYWAVPADGVIHRADLDGANIETLPIGDENYQALTLDLVHGAMYMVATFEIYSADLDGNRFAQTYEGTYNTQSIAVNPAQGNIYWTDCLAPRDGWVYRAKTDGSQAEAIVKQTGCFGIGGCRFLGIAVMASMKGFIGLMPTAAPSSV